MFHFIKHLKSKLLNLWHYFFPVQKVSIPFSKLENSKSSVSLNPQSKKDLRVNRDRSAYNQKDEVKAKKRLLYLKNKERYYQNKKKKRDLVKKLKKKD